MRVAVLGCGPAGLLAAQACYVQGVDYEIFSLKKKSRIGGAQYLYTPIPGITKWDPDGMLMTHHLGTKDNYAKRVYGHPEAETSWDEYLPGERGIWNMQAAYDRLWLVHHNVITERDINPGHPYVLNLQGFDLILSCVPRKAICLDVEEHTFTKQDVWIEFMSPGDEELLNPMTVIYNGVHETNPMAPPWYRASEIFGSASCEYGYDPTLTQSIRISKPLRTDCDCYGNMPFIPLGRYGEWKKGRLIHHAFEGAMDALLQV